MELRQHRIIPGGGVRRNNFCETSQKHNPFVLLFIYLGAFNFFKI